MRRAVLLCLVLAACAGPRPRPVATEAQAPLAGEAPSVSVGGNLRGYYGRGW
ncbi:hypothetical protein [Paracraurococcus lichenis]|uniref:Lipoprotein n=1 Tax=Paracraurococcus lichenis TaxID=3064888 RepID=A0ABT9E0D4_9PROT|nr:hypothetical protein [Paracraurococcus sp. LOR1-02]MDO9709628.1 hypothetical protein [Paracraurococcus sp. LOR1-02]